MKQLSLNLQTTENLDPYSADNFVLLEENSAAFHFLEKFFAQKDFATAQFQSLILKGPALAGKTHLLHIFAQKFNAEFIEIKKLTRKNLVKKFHAGSFYIVEDIDKITSEETLLHLINSAFEAKAFLILSSRNHHLFELRDLNSRLKNIFSLQIKEPSFSTIEMLLTNAFARRQIKISTRIIKLVAENISRSYEAIFAAVKKIEDHCQETGKSPTAQQLSQLLLFKL